MGQSRFEAVFVLLTWTGSLLQSGLLWSKVSDQKYIYKHFRNRMKDLKLRNQNQELNLLEGAQRRSGSEASSRQKLLRQEPS